MLKNFYKTSYNRKNSQLKTYDTVVYSSGTMGVNDTDWDGLQDINERNKITFINQNDVGENNMKNGNKQKFTFIKVWILNIKFFLFLNFLMMLIIILILFFILLHSNNFNNNCNKLEDKNENKNSDILPYIKRSDWGTPIICDYKFQNYMKTKIRFVIPKSILFFCTHVKGSNCKNEFYDKTSFHIKSGYDDIYYHYIIGGDGSIYEGRPFDCMNDSKFKFENGYSTLVIGIGFCFSDTITSEIISKNEYNSIIKLIKYLQHEKIVSSNYKFDFPKDCENSSIINKFKNNFEDNIISFYSYNNLIENYNVLTNMSHFKLIKKKIYNYKNLEQMLVSHEELQRHWSVWQPIFPCNIINKYPPYFAAIKIINDNIPGKTFCDINATYCSTNWLKQYHEHNNITTHFVINENGRICKSMAVNCNFNEKNNSGKIIITLQNCKNYEDIQSINIYNGILDIIREYRFYLTESYDVEYCDNNYELSFIRELLLLTFNITMWKKNSNNFQPNCHYYANMTF